MTDVAKWLEERAARLTRVDDFSEDAERKDELLAAAAAWRAEHPAQEGAREPDGELCAAHTDKDSICIGDGDDCRLAPFYLSTPPSGEAEGLRKAALQAMGLLHGIANSIRDLPLGQLNRIECRKVSESLEAALHAAEPARGEAAACDKPHQWKPSDFADSCVWCEMDRLQAELVRCDTEGHAGKDVGQAERLAHD